MSPVIEYLAGSRNAGIDLDADWLPQSDSIPAARFNPRTWWNRYVLAIPMEFIRQTLISGDALALLQVALAAMRMCGTTEIAIGPALCAEVDNPSKRVRTRLLRQIACLSESVCMVVAPKGRPHLL